MAVNLSAMAQQASQQGQQMLGQDQANAAQYKNQYGDYTNQANQANQQVKDYTNYMAGAGSATNLYNTGKQQAFAEQGFNPQSLAAATQNLTQSQNALSGLNTAAQMGVNSGGLTGAQLASRYASLTNPLQGVVGAQNNAVGNLQQLYQNSLTNANQYAGLGVQGEQQTLSGYQDVYSNAANQRDQAASMMNFYDNLSQQQGGLNAQQQQYYAQAQQAYQAGQAALMQAQAAAQQAAAQSALLGSQTNYQNLQNTAAQKALASQASQQGQQDINNYYQQNGLSWNGQRDNTGAKIMTAKF